MFRTMFLQRSQAMARAVWEALGVQPDSCTELQREVVGAFVFGMLSADGMTSLLPEAVTLLREEVGYAPDSGAQFAEELIRAVSDPKYHDTLYAIVHRGVDGHA